MSLESIIENAHLLLHITLNANVGFAEISADREKLIFTNKEKELLKWLERLESLKNQRREQEYALQIQKHMSTFNLVETANEFRLKEEIKKKEKELALLRTKNMVKDKVIGSVEIGRAILSSLYSSNSGSHVSCLTKLVNERDSLVSEFLTSHQELLKARTELAKLQQSVIMCHNDNRELTRKIKDVRSQSSASTSADLNRLQRDLSEAEAKLEVTKNVLQDLILESGVNWVADEHLLKLMLNIGKEI
ncbi:8981_t:CDS:2 [Acaulospora morrowiae]|uniref:8981_t:CDS:1 n=1 Tax=Acaulospora morrowiae TaxID=94023 RepID=A0A9N9C5G4_9GLOM|nr:8981_t:CDS:2 [Acaulospora morrowiae]